MLHHVSIVSKAPQCLERIVAQRVRHIPHDLSLENLRAIVQTDDGLDKVPDACCCSTSSSCSEDWPRYRCVTIGHEMRHTQWSRDSHHLLSPRSTGSMDCSRSHCVTLDCSQYTCIAADCSHKHGRHPCCRREAQARI
jgi:hypothetical protein